MARNQSAAWRDNGCALCTDERNAAADAYFAEHHKKPPAGTLPYVRMAVAQCHGWVTPIAGQPGREHLLPICAEHLTRRGKAVLCTECAHTPKTAPVKRAKSVQASLFEFCEVPA